MVLLGNKSDLESEREVSLNEALQYAANIDAKYFETSALSNQGEREKRDVYALCFNVIFFYCGWL